MRAIVDKLGELLQLIIFFGSLLLLGSIGLGLRRSFETLRSGYWHQYSKRQFFLSLIGLAIILAIGGYAYSLGKWLVVGIYVGLALIPFVLGWNGILLVPELFGDDDHYLEAPEMPNRTNDDSKKQR